MQGSIKVFKIGKNGCMREIVAEIGLDQVKMLIRKDKINTKMLTRIKTISIDELTHDIFIGNAFGQVYKLSPSYNSF